MAIVSFLILKMLMLVSVCEKAFGKIGKDEKGKGGIHSGAFLNLLIFPYVYGKEVFSRRDFMFSAKIYRL